MLKSVFVRWPLLCGALVLSPLCGLTAADPSPAIPPLAPLDNLPASVATPGLQTLSLDGDWTLTGHDPASDKKIEVPARVPGMVHPDLLRAGIIKDPFWRMQADDCQWIEHWTWTYARNFTVPEGFPLEWVVLRFEGLDTYATVRVNGQEIGSSDDMFIPFEFAVGQQIHAGVNHIEVAFKPVAEALQGKPYQKISTLFDRSHERTYARKLACTFGWDWVHRLVSAGIWRSVKLTAYGPARIEDVFVSTTALGKRPEADPATLHVEMITAWPTPSPATQGLRARWQLCGPGGETVVAESAGVGIGTTKFDLTVPNPQLWWPNGAGAQPLYMFRVELTDSQGKVLDRASVETAVRTVAIEHVPDAIGRSFTMIVNGTRVFGKGGNWVPADPFRPRSLPHGTTG